MNEIEKSSDKLNPSEIAAELVKKAALLKKKTAKLKERMEITQQEVSKALNSHNSDQPKR